MTKISFFDYLDKLIRGLDKKFYPLKVGDLCVQFADECSIENNQFFFYPGARLINDTFWIIKIHNDYAIITDRINFIQVAKLSNLYPVLNKEIL